MKKTTILVRGFDCDFEITLIRKEFMSIESAELYIRKEIVSTAFIRGVIHHEENNNITIMNLNYKSQNYQFAL